MTLFSADMQQYEEKDKTILPPQTRQRINSTLRKKKEGRKIWTRCGKDKTETQLKPLKWKMEGRKIWNRDGRRQGGTQTSQMDPYSVPGVL